MGKFDAGGKRSIHLYARAWAEWIVQQEHLQIESELSGEFQIATCATDVLLKVRNETAGTFLSLTELQLQYMVKMPRRLAAYAAFAREKYELEVFVAIVCLRPPPKGVKIEEKFYSEFMGQIAQQDFKVIRLWELGADTAGCISILGRTGDCHWATTIWVNLPMCCPVTVT